MLRTPGATGTGTGHGLCLIGSFGRVELSVRRAGVRGEDGRSHEFHSTLLPRYKRLTGSANALIAGAYLAGVNTRRVPLALGTLVVGAVSEGYREPRLAPGTGGLRGLKPPLPGSTRTCPQALDQRRES